MLKTQGPFDNSGQLTLQQSRPCRHENLPAQTTNKYDNAREWEYKQRNSGLPLAGPTGPQNRLTAQPSWGQVNQTLRGHPQTATVQFSLVFTMQTCLRVQNTQVFPRFWAPPGRGPRRRRRATQGKLGTQGRLGAQGQRATKGQLDRSFRLHGLVRRRTRTQLIDLID